jgi:hypothetical protein
MAVYGFGFNSGENVNTFIFGTTTATGRTDCSHEFCFVTPPALAAGKFDVRAIVNGAESAKTKADLYTIV